MLDQLQELTDLDRHYLAWKLRTYGQRQLVTLSSGETVTVVAGHWRRRKRANRRVYGAAFKRELVALWECFDYLCGKRLAPMLREWVPILRVKGELTCSDEIAGQLTTVSAATIDRLLSDEKSKLRFRKGSSHTKPTSLLRAQIPVVTWHEARTDEPGHFQIDLVGHDGGVTFGPFAFTLDATDIYSGWVEPRPLLNKAQRWTTKALADIHARCPIPLQSLHSDNGGEFINRFLQSWCRSQSIAFRRGRSSRSNDTCYVEQKNYSVVRQAVGYARFDTAEEVELMRDLYDAVRLLVNFCYPSMRLIERTRDGAPVTRRHDSPRTPCQRLIESPYLPTQIKDALRRQRRSLNPLELKRTIHRIQGELLDRSRQKDLSLIRALGPSPGARAAHEMLFAR